MNIAKILSYLKKNFVLGICGAVVLVCLCVYIVRGDQITRQAADYDDLSVRSTRILKNLKYASDIEADLEVVRTTMNDVESRLFSPEDLATNQRYFYKAESVAGVDMTSIQQIIKPLPDGKLNKKSRKEAENSKFQEIIYEMDVQGTYVELLSFIREIEGGSAFSILEGLSVVPSKTDSSEVSMSISVSLLGRKSL